MDFLVGLLIFTIWNLKTTSSHPVLNNGNDIQIQPGDFPFHCVIRIRPISDEDFLLCEGAIIDKKWALTAGGCVDKYKSNPELLEIVAGIVSTENIRKQSHVQVRKVSQIKLSPLWTDSKKKSGDIALLEVKKIFKFNKYVNSANFENNTSNNDEALLIGYGDSDKVTSTILKMASSEECLQKNDNPSELFCAKKNNAVHVFRDISFAGAPLVKMNNSSDKAILAIFSAEHPDKFIKLAFHKLWIENTAKIDLSNPEGTTQSSAISSGEHKKTSDDGRVTDGLNNSTNTNNSSVDEEDEEEEEDSSESEENTEAPEESEESVEDSTSEETTETASNTSEEQDETPSDESDSEEESITEKSSDESIDETFESEEESTTPPPDESSESSESTESDESDENATTSSPNPTTTSPSSSTSAPSTSTTTSSPASTTSSPSTTPSPSPAPTTTSTSSTTTSTTASPTTSSTTLSSTTSSTTTITTTPDYYDDYDSDDNTTSTSPSSHNHNYDQYDIDTLINPPNSAEDTNAVTSNSAQSSNPLLISSLASKAKSLVSSFKQLKNFFAIS